MMMKRAVPFLIPLAYAVMVMVNVLAAAGLINGTSQSEISRQYPTVVTPAGYAFSIWSLIYLGLAGFALWQCLPAQRVDGRLTHLRHWFLASCGANIGWLLAWHFDQILLSLGLMLTLLGTLIMANQAIPTQPSKRWHALLMNATFGLYVGWTLLATSLNLLVATIALDLNVAESAPLGATLVVCVAAIGVWLSNRLRRTALVVAMAWGIVAIAVRHQALPIVSITAMITALVLTGSAIPWRSLLRASAASQSV